MTCAIGGIPFFLLGVGWGMGWWQPARSGGGFAYSGFSWGTLFSSFSGLALFTLCILGLGANLFFYIRVSKKIRSWMWV
jgi:hypothetical protein